MTARERKAAMAPRFELSIECVDEEVAAALDQALMPDNRYFPKDQEFRASKEGQVIRYEVDSPRVRPALTTMTSLLGDTRLFSEVWIEAKTGGLGFKERKG